MVDEFREKFAGTWKSDRVENFEEFLAAMGVNYIVRKMAGLARPENYIEVEKDGTIVIKNNSGFMKNEQRFKIDEEFEEINSMVKKRFKNRPEYKDGKLRITPTPVDPIDTPYPEYAEREITDAGEMQVTIKVGNTVCRR